MQAIKRKGKYRKKLKNQAVICLKYFQIKGSKCDKASKLDTSRRSSFRLNRGIMTQLTID